MLAPCERGIRARLTTCWTVEPAGKIFSSMMLCDYVPLNPVRGRLTLCPARKQPFAHERYRQNGIFDMKNIRLLANHYNADCLMT